MKNRTGALSPLVSCHILVTSGSSALLVRRARPPFAGWWGLPGGLVEPGETLAAAVRRELLEETGVAVSTVGRPISIMESIPEEGSESAHYVTFVYHAALPEQVEPSAGDDAEAARWFTRPEYQELILTDMAYRAMQDMGLPVGLAPEPEEEFPAGVTVLFHDHHLKS